MNGKDKKDKPLTIRFTATQYEKLREFQQVLNASSIGHCVRTLVDLTTRYQLTKLIEE